MYVRGKRLQKQITLRNKIYKSVCENTFLKIYLPSAQKSKLPSHQVFGVFALEENKILQATPSKWRWEMGMCTTATYVQQKQ